MAATGNLLFFHLLITLIAASLGWFSPYCRIKITTGVCLSRHSEPKDVPSGQKQFLHIVRQQRDFIRGNISQSAKNASVAGYEPLYFDENDELNDIDFDANFLDPEELQEVGAALEKENPYSPDWESQSFVTPANDQDNIPLAKIWEVLEQKTDSEAAAASASTSADDVYNQIMNTERDFLELRKQQIEASNTPVEDVVIETELRLNDRQTKQLEALQQDVENFIQEFDRLDLERCRICNCVLHHENNELHHAICRSCHVENLRQKSAESEASRQPTRRYWTNPEHRRRTDSPVNRQIIEKAYRKGATKESRVISKPSEALASTGVANEKEPVAHGSWKEVVDPDSGEVFYWNEETEEMRWEIDD